MKNHLLEKLHPNLTRGTLLNIFKILKNLTEKSYGAFKIWRQKNQHENPHPILMAFGPFAIFWNPQILKGKKDMPKFLFFLNFG